MRSCINILASRSALSEGERAKAWEEAGGARGKASKGNREGKRDWQIPSAWALLLLFPLPNTILITALRFL